MRFGPKKPGDVLKRITLRTSSQSPSRKNDDKLQSLWWVRPTASVKRHNNSDLSSDGIVMSPSKRATLTKTEGVKSPK